MKSKVVFALFKWTGGEGGEKGYPQGRRITQKTKLINDVGIGSIPTTLLAYIGKSSTWQTDRRKPTREVKKVAISAVLADEEMVDRESNNSSSLITLFHELSTSH